MDQETLVFAPELGLAPGDFVAAWNGDAQSRQAALASEAQGQKAVFDPMLAAGAMAVLGSIAVGLATNALYDLIKAAIQQGRARRGLPPLAVTQIEIRRIPQPDGSIIEVITLKRQS